MGKLLASLLALFGSTQQASQPEVRMVDPSTLYFSMSTISDGLPELEPVKETPDPSEPIFHEDEWRQIEFYPKDRLGEIQSVVTTLANFEAKHRQGNVFKEIFVRKIPDGTVFPSAASLGDLEGILHAKQGGAPVLFHGSNSVSGRVKGGFSVSLGPDVYLYGLKASEGISILGATVNADGDHQLLTNAFMRLSRDYGLIAVDWRSHLVLVGVASDGNIEAWRPD